MSGTAASKDCRRCRRQLARRWDRGEGLSRPGGEALDRHLGECPSCATFARRLAATRGALQAHHAEVEPPSMFATKVVAAVRAREVAPAEILGAFALRFLPAAVVLALALGVATLGGAAWNGAEIGEGDSFAAQSTAAAPSEDFLAWVLEDLESGESQ